MISRDQHLDGRDPGFGSDRVAAKSVRLREHRMFPDRHLLFHFVDQPLARGECLAPVAGDDLDPKRGFAHSNRADPVNQSDRFDGPAGLDGVEKFFELMSCHGLMGFVVDPVNGGVLLRAPNDAREGNRSAGFG